MIVEYYIFFISIMANVQYSNGKMKCEIDALPVEEGIQKNIARFPWLGIVQHSYRLTNKTVYAITTGVLIHPGWVLAPAEDIAKVPMKNFQNNTNFIVWRADNEKISLNLLEYVLHHDYLDGYTFTTFALLQLERWSEFRIMAPVKPACTPTKGGGAFHNLFVVKLTDEYDGEIMKQVLNVDHVTEEHCLEFYSRSQLDYDKMKPRSQLCAVVKKMTSPCIWDSGAVLMGQQKEGNWVMLGYGTRGPGCGAPARFLNIHSSLPWIADVASGQAAMRGGGEEELAFVLRRMSPNKLRMVQVDGRRDDMSKVGQCDDADRGKVMFRDTTLILTSKPAVQGFYYVEVAQIASFSCVMVELELVTKHSPIKMWVAHDCHQDTFGLAPGLEMPNRERKQCFYYFRSTAFIEFRWAFDYQCIMRLALYGADEDVRKIPDPFTKLMSTTPWAPTDTLIRKGYFVPYYRHWWFL